MKKGQKKKAIKLTVDNEMMSYLSNMSERYGISLSDAMRMLAKLGMTTIEKNRKKGGEENEKE